MATNTLKTRIQHKNGLPAEWEQATNFVPLKGELIVYNDATAPKIKIGDGSTLVGNLPFVGGSDSTGYLPLTGGTLTGNINIQGADFPTFCLQPTTANSAGTYTGAFFEGSYYDNVSMWVWTDRNNNAKSRRGLVLKGYAESADDNYALVLRKCDTNGNWKNDSYILTSDSFSSYALPLTGGSMQGQIWFNGDFSYPGIWFRNPDNNKNIGAVYMNPAANNYMHIRWARDDGSGDGYYYLNGSSADGTVSASTFEGTHEAGSITSTTYKHFRVSRLGSDGDYAQGFFYVTSSGASAQIGVNKNGTTIGTATFGTNFQHTGKVIAAGATFSQDVIMSGSSAITSTHTGGTYGTSRDTALIKHTTHAASSSYSPIYSLKGLSGNFASGLIHHTSGESKLEWIYVLDSNYNAGNNTYTKLMTLTSAGALTATSVYGAVWNDYAEYRSQNETIEPGYITYCDDDGKLKKTTERLQKFEGVVSDTFGFAIGETDDCKTPLAVSGRALVYCDPEEEHFHSGDCVCAGPDGLAYRMTREEVIDFPDRIVGIVSEIPTYETWGTGNVKVDGRIWIKVK